MKILSILALGATVIAVPAFAETTTEKDYSTLSASSQATAPTVANDSTKANSQDLSFAFADSQNLQLTAMTNQEMAETQGAFLPPPVIYYGVVYGVPAMYAAARWASGPGPQILSHRIHNWRHNR